MDVYEIAKKEVDEEIRRERINAEKAKIRERRKSFWSRLIKTLTTKKIVIRLENKNV